MRLLYVCADPGIPLDGAKGASVHVRQTIGALIGKGWRISVAAARDGGTWKAPCKLLAVRGRSTPGGKGHRPDSAPLDREIASIEAARRLAESVTLVRGDVDVVYERSSLWSFAGMILAEKLGAPLVVEVNAPLPVEAAKHRGLELVGLAEEIESLLMRKATAVLCVSGSLVRRVSRLRGSAEGVWLLPNAVDTDRFRPRRTPPGEDPGAIRGTRRRSGPGGRSPDRDPVVIFTGSLKPWHGLPVLMEAFAGLRTGRPAARLMIVGDGPERMRLEPLAESLGLGRSVRFMGAVAHEEVPAHLRRADIAVAPYPPVADFYFSPLKLAEYLAAGLPVVTSAGGDSAELLRDGKTALLVPPGNATALRRALVKLASNSVLRRRLARQGRRLAVEKLSLAFAASRLDSILRGAVLAERSPSGIAHGARTALRRRALR